MFSSAFPGWIVFWAAINETELLQAPLASASIGQVHAARLPNGDEVVVKVQRPGVATQVGRDLNVFLELADLMARYSSLDRDY